MRRDVDAVAALSHVQQRLLCHTPCGAASLLASRRVIALRGPLDPSTFARAWRHVAARHQVLRASFHWEGVRAPLMAVWRAVSLDVDVHDWRAYSIAEQEGRLRTFLSHESARGFVLTQAPLVRLALIRRSDEDWWLHWCHHPLILDARSAALVVREAFAAYAAFRDGHPPALPEMRSLTDYLAWLQRQDHAAAEAFWRRTMRSVHAPTMIRSDLGDTTIVPHGSWGRRWLDLPMDETRAVRALAARHGAAVDVGVQTAWAVLLCQYTRTDDLIFGITSPGPPADLAHGASIAGPFTTTLPLRLHVARDRPVAALAAQVHDQQQLIRAAAYIPLASIQQWSGVPAGTPLFDSRVELEDAALDRALTERMGDLEIVSIDGDDMADCPLSVAIETGQHLRVKATFDASRYGADGVERLLQHVRAVLLACAAEPQRRVCDLIAGAVLSNPFQNGRYPTGEESSCAMEQGRVAPVGGETLAPFSRVPLSASQRAFFEFVERDAHQYNLAHVFEIDVPLSHGQLAAIVRALAVRHDALRLRFHRMSSGWQADVGPVDGAGMASVLDHGSLSDAEADAALARTVSSIQASLDLEYGPLYRLVMIRRGPRRPVKLLALVHHMAADGVSLRSLHEGLRISLEQIARGERVDLPSVGATWRQWVERLAAEAQTDAARAAVSAWEAFGSAPAALPRDYAGANVQDSERQVVTHLKPADTAALLALAARGGLDVAHLLLAAVTRAVAAWSGRSFALIDWIGHGREPLFDDLDVSRTVGYFSVRTPLRLECRADEPILASARSMRRYLWTLPYRTVGFSMLRYLCNDARIRRRMVELPRPEISVNYLRRVDDGRASDLLAPTDDPVGPLRAQRQQRVRPIRVMADSADGRLRMIWKFSTNLHRTETIERLANDTAGWLNPF